jgi:hypothetical protein
MTEPASRLAPRADWALTAGLVVLASGCAPEVGSQAWCERMDETPQGDWTGNQAADYARQCLFDR